jgi:hypothetical protein
MAAISTALLIGSAVLGAAATVHGISQQRKAAKQAAAAQREANKARQGQAAIENRARRAKLIRQRQQSQAQAENVQASGSGAGVSTSMATGALATANTQGQVNLANFAELGRQGGLLADAKLAFGRAQSRANLGKSFVGLGGTLLSNAQRIGGAGGQMANMFSTGSNLGGFAGPLGSPRAAGAGDL